MSTATSVLPAPRTGDHDRIIDLVTAEHRETSATSATVSLDNNPIVEKGIVQDIENAWAFHASFQRLEDMLSGLAASVAKPRRHRHEESRPSTHRFVGNDGRTEHKRRAQRHQRLNVRLRREHVVATLAVI